MMHFNQILVVKETRENEKRVALTPSAVARLTQQGYRIFIEEDAGVQSGFSNSEYAASGAEIFVLDSSSGFPANTFIVRVLRPSKERELIENKLFHENTAMLGFLFPFVADNHISSWQALGLTTLSFDLFKSISIHDPKNAQAAMSRIAGRLAFHDALKHYKGDKPRRLTVIGAGAAGISAALEAARHHVPVQLFGRKESLGSEFDVKGITYHVLPEAETEIDFIRSFLAEETLVITAARTPGKKAPLLLDENSLGCLSPHAVVVDLAISNGSNVRGSKPDQIIHLENGVLLVNVSGYPKTEPRSSSEAYSQCIISLLTEIMSPGGEVSFENQWVKELWVTHAGQRHDALYDGFDASAPKPSCYWVYILLCENNTYYTGFTNDLLKRYQSHVDGTGRCKYTRSFKPVKIAQSWQISGGKAEAMRIERFIKKLSRMEKERIIADPLKLILQAKSEL